MTMLSEALSIMDRNTERLMVTELQEAVAAAETKAEVFRLRLSGKTPEEISDRLCLALAKVNEILAD